MPAPADITIPEQRTVAAPAAGGKTQSAAELLVNCWEGAALRSRLKRSPAPLTKMLEFYLSSLRTPLEWLLTPKG